MYHYLKHFNEPILRKNRETERILRSFSPLSPFKTKNHNA